MFHVELVKLAELQIEQGDFNKAQQSLTKALQYNPNYSWANLRMANLLLKENKIEYAEQHLANVLESNFDKDSNLKDAINILQSMGPFFADGATMKVQQGRRFQPQLAQTARASGRSWPPPLVF